MFTLKYLLKTIKKQKMATMATVLLVAATSLLITLGSAAANSVKEANEQAMKPLEKIGADLTLVRHVKKKPGIFIETLPQGIHKNFLSVYFREEKESEKTITSIFENVSVPLATAGVFSREEVDKIKNFPEVEKVSALLTAFYSYYRSEQEKIILPEEEIKPNLKEISDEELAELEKKLDSDPQFQQLVKEQHAILNKPEWTLTKEDQKKLDELTWKIYQREMELFHQWRPDVFPEPPKRERKEIQPPPPKETMREFSIAGMEPNVGYLQAGDILTGRYFTDGDQGKKVAILRKDFAERNKLAVGDKIKLVDTEYEVIGIGWPKLMVNAPEVYVPLKSLQNQLDADGTVNLVFIKAKSSAGVQSLKEKLAKEFPDAEITDNGRAAEVVKPSVSGSAAVLAKFSSVISGVLFAITGIIVTLLAVYNLSKRQKEIAVLRAMGWSGFRVSACLIADVFVKILAGLVLGWGLSFALVPVLGEEAAGGAASASSLFPSTGFFDYLAGRVSSDQVPSLHISADVALTAAALLKAAVIALLVGVIAGLVIARRMQSIKIAEVLRRP